MGKSRNAALIFLCLYIFLVIERPWESIRFLQGIPIEKAFAIIMIFAAILTGKFKVESSPTNKWVYGLLGLHFVLAPFAFEPEFAFDQAIEYAKMVVVYLLMLSVCDDERSLKTVIRVFVLSTLVYMGHSLWEYHNGRHEWRMGIARMIGVGEFLSDPNAFGATIVLSFPFTYALLRIETNTFLRMMCYGYLALGTVCVVLTGSRSASLAFVVAFLVWGLAQQGKRRLLTFGTVVLAMWAIWTYMPEGKQERIRTLWDADAGPANAYLSAEGRMAGWKSSWEMFKRNPLTGVGAGGKNFVGYRIAHEIDKIDEQRMEQSHILYGEILAEHGIFGGILFTGFVLSIARSTIKVRQINAKGEKRADITFSLSGAIFVSLILLLFLGLAGHNFYRPLWLWLAAWSGSLLKIVEQNKGACEREPTDEFG